MRYGGREARNGQRYGGHGREAWGTSQSQRQGGTDHKKRKSVDNTTSFFSQISHMVLVSWTCTRCFKGGQV